jgi:hypothetical protein
MSEAINMHKRIAMGGESEANHLKKGGVAKKHHYAKGGAVAESKASTLINNSSQKQALPKPGGKIATMKKGGPAKTGIAILLAPMRKSAGRGR